MPRPADRTRLVLQAAVALLAVYLCLLGAAIHKRESSLHELTERIVREATASAENGPADYDKYLYEYPGMPWQTGAVYLFEHGHCDPRVERILLLMEARRSYDGQYVSSFAMNSDLREWLIPRCLENYPEDPLVAWAAGRTALILGDFDTAAHELTRARDLGFDPIDAGESPGYFFGRQVTAYALSGRKAELEAWLKKQHVENPADTAALGDLAEYYCLCDRQAEAIALLEDAPDLNESERLSALLRRAYWWGGRLDEYRAFVEKSANAEGVELYALDPWIALLDGDQAAFDLQLPPGNTQRWRAMADVYAVTRRPQIISNLYGEARYYEHAPSEDLSWSEESQLRNQTRASYGQLFRAHILAGDWDQALALDQSFAIDDNYYYYSTPARQSKEILLSLYQGDKSSDIGRGLDNLAYALPNLILSRSFSQAVEHSGMSREEVLAKLTADLPSYPGHYYDYGNGVFNPACR